MKLPAEIGAALQRIEAQYEIALRSHLTKISDPELYAIFVPYYGWGMPAEDSARAGLVVHHLGSQWKESSDINGYYTWGEFIDNVPQATLESETLKADLQSWYVWMADQEEDHEIAASLGRAIARVCHRLNTGEDSPAGKGFASDFVVFTDYMEPDPDPVDLGHCVSAEWLARQQAQNLVTEYITIPKE